MEEVVSGECGIVRKNPNRRMWASMGEGDLAWDVRGPEDLEVVTLR